MLFVLKPLSSLLALEVTAFLAIAASWPKHNRRPDESPPIESDPFENLNGDVWSHEIVRA